jgi:hypothetical protein
LVIDPVANTAIWVRIIAAVAGAQVAVAAGGTDTNIDLALVPKGTGLLNLGVPTSTSATAGSAGALPAQVAGYATIKVGGVACKFPFYT